ncbi:MAG: tunicamycin resistance protein [Anaerolineales bacterium]|nr:tunicamycin resistance protein [Anaerolineales bacterium]
MIIWINGAFGAGKTTVTKLLAARIPEACIFDPEDIGYVVQKTFPEARELDYQDLAMWRQLVVQFIVQGSRTFQYPLIIPMTMIVPAYIDEIFSKIRAIEPEFHHFFLSASSAVLRKRIIDQVIIESSADKDEEVRQWRLAQIDRCVDAMNHMPEGTRFLATDANLPADLVASIHKTCFR